mgnify:CR=1 FL=1
MRSASGSSSNRSGRNTRPGTVYLVGAGPGDPGLLTVRAAQLLRRADIVIHDALVSEGIIAMISESAERVDVGKRCGGKSTAQAAINALLVEAARKHRSVVRLKGGDPYVFGRGGEEALALQEAGIRFEVVPGVTAAVGVSAYAGIPLTHRDFASSVTFVTGHEGRPDDRVDWKSLAALQSTLAIYMGVGGLERISAALINGGRAAETPAAVIEWGTHARQRTVTGSLGDIAELARDARVGAPALVVVGEVAALREQLAWFDSLPLRGVRLVIGRSRPQPSRIAKALRALGADVLEHPRLRSDKVENAQELDKLFSRLTSADWLLFTSAAAVERFRVEAEARELDARVLARVRVASLGAATTKELRRFGIRADLSTRTFDEGRVLEGMSGFGSLAGSTVLFPREAHLDSHVAGALRISGATVLEAEIFRTVPVDDGADAADLITSADFLILPSSTAAAAVASALRGEAVSGRVIAIGPKTAATAEALGFGGISTASDHSVEGIVDLVLDLATPKAAAGLLESSRSAAFASHLS